ncbi:MAG: preprotein translocase subunit YajC [Phycisphaerales bacterium]|nr:preprotein translocase subunit YajC [Phycisphaerales bacterium]MDG1977773.1 preprotein translocase subunit YajC [Phycisphaerales bacterium]MDG2133237.1 preprotein translocase subunit YajC [Phycisphaerales bacterium]
MIASHQADLSISLPPATGLFAQASPPLGRQGTGTIAADGAAGGDPNAAAQAEPGGGDFLLFMFLPLILVMILFSVFGQRKERKKREALLSSVKKHDRIRTIGGVIGSVVELNTDTVVLKVDESSNTRMTFGRDAVQQVLESE